MAKLLPFGILGFLQPTGKFWENCGIMKPFEMIRKGWGLSATGQDKHGPSGRLEHYQTVHMHAALGENPTPASLGPWAPFLKRRSSALAGKYDVEGWSGGLGSVWGTRFEEKHIPA